MNWEQFATFGTCELLRFSGFWLLQYKPFPGFCLAPVNWKQFAIFSTCELLKFTVVGLD